MASSSSLSRAAILSLSLSKIAIILTANLKRQANPAYLRDFPDKRTRKGTESGFEGIVGQRYVLTLTTGNEYGLRVLDLSMP